MIKNDCAPVQVSPENVDSVANEALRTSGSPVEDLWKADSEALTTICVY